MEPAHHIFGAKRAVEQVLRDKDRCLSATGSQKPKPSGTNTLPWALHGYLCLLCQSLECDRLTGDHRALSATLGNLGNICAVSGRRESAQELLPGSTGLQKY